MKSQKNSQKKVKMNTFVRMDELEIEEPRKESPSRFHEEHNQRKKKEMKDIAQGSSNEIFNWLFKGGDVN